MIAVEQRAEAAFANLNSPSRRPHHLQGLEALESLKEGYKLSLGMASGPPLLFLGASPPNAHQERRNPPINGVGGFQSALLVVGRRFRAAAWDTTFHPVDEHF